jgi:hypothetical protein
MGQCARLRQDGGLDGKGRLKISCEEVFCDDHKLVTQPVVCRVVS